METMTNAQSDQFTGKLFDAMTLWTDANQKILRDLASFSASALEEGIQLCGNLQTSTLDAVREAQGCWMSRQSEWGEWKKDPFGAYQKGLLEGMQEVQKGLRVLEANALAITRAAGRLQATAEKTSSGLRETCFRLGAETKDLFAPPQN